ncbi:UNVERIFIED_CONTAM: hypothetical protein Sradi_2091600 [Sesamum radiatum]|uniref:Zinc knuckle CX2CX4HX4C domain-containing protein n=1 Tax=Sesamum radiatum TaxID=300843 RepID=A0AAW2TK25_SESRA
MDQDLNNLRKSHSITNEEETDTLIPTGVWHKEAEIEGFYVVDWNRVMERTPWAYDKNLIILAKVDGNENSKDIDLNWCEFFVLVHRLPLGKMNLEIANFVGNQLGKFINIDMEDKSGFWGSSLRIHVALDVNKPLRRVMKLRTTLGDEHISFTYERLPNFCYLCCDVRRILYVLGD